MNEAATATVGLKTSSEMLDDLFSTKREAEELRAMLQAIKRHGELGNVSTGGWHGSKPAGNPMSKDVWQFPRHMLTRIDALLAAPHEGVAVEQADDTEELRAENARLREALELVVGSLPGERESDLAKEIFRRIRAALKGA